MKRLKTTHRIILVLIIGIASLTMMAGWLSQHLVDSFCYAELRITAATNVLFWLGCVPFIRFLSQKWTITPHVKRSNVALHSLASLGLVGFNQFVVHCSIAGVLWFFFGCEKYSLAWSQGLLTNNIFLNFFCYWGILGILIYQQRTTKKVNTQTSNFISIKDRESLIRLAINDITWVESSKNCVVIHTQNKKYVQYQSLKSIQEELGTNFLRIHRSRLININYLLGFSSKSSGDGSVILSTGETLNFSRTYRQEIKALLKQ